MDYIINMILHKTNRVLLLFNRCITCYTILYVDDLDDDRKKWKHYKNYFEINYNIVSKTDNKNYYKIEKQIKLFEYKFKRK